MERTVTKETMGTATEVACLIGVTARRVHQLVQDGVITSNGSTSGDSMNLSDAVQAYIAYIKRDADKATSDDEKIERNKKSAEALLKASKAKIAQFEAKELEGKMHRSEDVETVLEDMLFTFRNALLALPGRLAIDVVACSTAPEASDVIQKEVHKIMRELADYHYDPSRFDALVRARREWDEEVKDDE